MSCETRRARKRGPRLAPLDIWHRRTRAGKPVAQTTQLNCKDSSSLGRRQTLGTWTPDGAPNSQGRAAKSPIPAVFKQHCKVGSTRSPEQ
eukprot:9490052-Alexandrium_andersonii.AAC.1